MNKIFRMVNALALQIKEETSKEVIAIRVFHNCLCIYFKKGSCRFYSKQGLNWGNTDICYFVSSDFNKTNISSRLKQQYESLINWTEEYCNANYIQRLWLMLEYNIKYNSN